MLAEESSPPPVEHDVEDTPSQSTLISSQAIATLPSLPARKRKRIPATASSPAPSDSGGTPSAGNPAELLSSRADLTSRPQLSISRGPVFITTTEGSEYYKTELIGVNRVGFRYVPAGINPPGYIQPCRTIESNPTAFRVSWEDRSPFITVTKDGLGLCGGTGFRSARCNAPITEGRWYMEVAILRGGGEYAEDGRHEGSHVRLGWGRREAPLNAPVGLDAYSYGYRDKTGDKVTLSRPRPYGRPYGTGDVIGMYISLPPRREANKKDPHDPAHIKRERIPIDLKGQEVFEMLEYPQSKEMISLMDYSAKTTSSVSVPSVPKKSATGKLPERGGPPNVAKTNTTPLRPLPTLAGSRIAFFVNGECQGIAFQDVYDYLQLRQSETSSKAKEKKRAREGVKEHRENPFNDGTLGYYPFVSLFNDACVRLNPGPNFDFPPPQDIDALLDGVNTEGTEQMWRPTCERYPEFMAEQWALDGVEEEEARTDAARAAIAEKAEAARKAERSRKRQQAEARKRAKLAATEQHATPIDEDRVVSVSFPIGTQPSPSPLRYEATYNAREGSADYDHSPAPTLISNGDLQGEQSGYNSDNMELDPENGEDTSEVNIPLLHDEEANT